MSDLVGNSKDRFSRVTADIIDLKLRITKATRAQLFKTNDIVS